MLTLRSGRTRWVLGLVVLVGGLAAAFHYLPLLKRTGAASGNSPRARINVILITVDTLRADRVSCYGSSSVATPTIDALARDGVRFANAASTVPLTLPAHASILTGRYPAAHGVLDNVGYSLGTGVPTLAEALHRAGWTTAGFVSAFVLDRRWGIARGFDHYFDDFDSAQLTEGMPADMSLVQRDGAETVAEAVRWLDRRPAGQPFFLWLHLYDPHDPYTPKEPFRSRHPGRPYDAEVAYADSLVGDFRRALDQRGLLDGSLLVFTSDHGEGLGEHGEATHGFFVYDTTVRVPLIVKLPARQNAGAVVTQTVSHVDLMPTIEELVGLSGSRSGDGASLVPLLAGQPIKGTRAAYSEALLPMLHYGWSPLRSVRRDRYKLIDAPRQELYDLSSDPGETANLAAKEPARLAQLGVELADLRHRVEKNKAKPARETKADDESLEKLRSLGYLGGQSSASQGDPGRRRIDPKDGIGLHEKIMTAQARLQANDAAGAARLLDEVVAADGAIAEVHVMLGETAVLSGDAQRAIASFRRALALNPTHERGLFGLAGAYAKLHRYDDALVGYERIVEIRGSDSRASLAIADLYVQQGRLDEAAVVLEEASAQSKATPFFLNKLGEIRAAQGRDDEARSLFERAIAPRDDFALPYFNLGVLDEKRGDVRAAMARYERATQIEPAFCRAQFNLGRLHASAGNVERARGLWEAALSSCPGFVEGHYYLAKLLMDTNGDLPRAEALVKSGIALDRGGSPLGYYLLADILNRTGHAAEARRAAAKGRAIEAAAR